MCFDVSHTDIACALGLWKSSSAKYLQTLVFSHATMSSKTPSIAAPSPLSSASSTVSNCWLHSFKKSMALLWSKTTYVRCSLSTVLESRYAVQMSIYRGHMVFSRVGSCKRIFQKKCYWIQSALCLIWVEHNRQIYVILGWSPCQAFHISYWMSELFFVLAIRSDRSAVRSF